MTADDQLDLAPPHVHPTALQISDVMSLFNAVIEVVRASQTTILNRLDANAEAAKDRWTVHDAEKGDVLKRLADLEELTKGVAKDHAAEVEADRIAKARFDARVGPAKKFISYVIEHWRDALLVAIGLLAVLSFLGDTVQHIIAIASGAQP